MSCFEDLLDVLMNCVYDEKAPSEELGNESIAALAHSECADIRIWAAKALAYDDLNCAALDTLCQLAMDEDPLVRVEAVDSLRAFSCPRSYAVMQSALLDSDCLVRAYAAFGIAVIGKTEKPDDAKEALLLAETRETENRALTGIYEGLYILGEKSAFNKLLGLFFLNDYQIQCSVLNALDEVMNAENYREIQRFADSIDSWSYPVAVTDALKRLQESCAENIRD